MGSFTGGGRVAVEQDARTVAEVDTRAGFAKVDGRFPHWVTPYEGERFSLIFYTTEGPTTPQRTAVFEEGLVFGS